MERVQTFDQYKDLINCAKSNGYKCSNCFFLPATIQRKIMEGTLSFLWIDCGLLLLDDRTDFFRCYYYLPESDLPERVSFSKDAIIEFPFSGSLADSQKDQIKKIEAMGFKLGRESRMMSASADHFEDLYRLKPLSSNIVCNAVKDDVPQILELLNASFNPLYAFLPTQEELLAAIHEERVLVVRKSNIIAVLISSFEKNTASIQQVAVASSFRGQGIGIRIVQRYHKQYVDKAKKFQHWVDITNTSAINMYKQLGYEFSMRRANEYVLRCFCEHNEKTIT